MANTYVNDYTGQSKRVDPDAVTVVGGPPFDLADVEALRAVLQAIHKLQSQQGRIGVLRAAAALLGEKL